MFPGGTQAATSFREEKCGLLIYRKKSVKTPPMDCTVGKLGLFRPFFQFTLLGPTRRGQVHVFGQRFLVNFIRSRRKMDQTPDFAFLFPKRFLP